MSPDSELNTNHSASGWYRGLPDLPSFPILSGSHDVPSLVIGTGFTGLAAARRLAMRRPDEAVWLVDAEQPAMGSSSRSSGFVVPIGSFETSSVRTFRDLHQLGTAGLERLRSLVEAHNIRCSWLNEGRWIAARSQRGMKSLAGVKKVLERLGSSLCIENSDQIEQRTGMIGYRGAIRQLDSAMVNPAALNQGLLLSLPENVVVFGRSPVKRLVNCKSHVTAEFPNAMLRAKRVLVAAHVGSIPLGVVGGRMFPMRTFISRARFRDQANANQDRPTNWGVTAVERVGSSVRSVDQELQIRSLAFFGATASDVPVELEKVAKFHRQYLARRFRDEDLEITSTWAGSLGITANGAGLFRRIDERTFLSTGYNGHGIAHGTIAGELMADWSLDCSSELLETIRNLHQPPWLPGGRLLKAGVKIYVGFLESRFRDEF